MIPQRISELGIDHIKGWEGLELEAYMPTPNDVPTIGIGHTKGVDMGLTCTERQAEVWLVEDLEPVEDAMERLVSAALTQTQYDMLVSWVFNVGVGAFRQSTLLRVLNEGRHNRVPSELRRWVYQDGRKVQGLINRRRDEAAKYQSEVTA